MRLATKCPHTDRRHHGKGLCKSCHTTALRRAQHQFPRQYTRFVFEGLTEDDTWASVVERTGIARHRLRNALRRKYPDAVATLDRREPQSMRARVIEELEFSIRTWPELERDTKRDRAAISDGLYKRGRGDLVTRVHAATYHTTDLTDIRVMRRRGNG